MRSRVNGVAEILDEPGMCDRDKIKNNSPKTVLRIQAQEILTHCGKAPLRASLWNPSSWPNKRPVATLFEMIRDHADKPVDSIEQIAVDERYRKSL